MAVDQAPGGDHAGAAALREAVTPRPLATVTVEDAGKGAFVVLRTDRKAEVRYDPFSADGVAAAISHLGSALAMTAMRNRTVLRGADFGGTLHQQGLPPETPDRRREIAAGLAKVMARDGISRPLFADMLGFHGTPAGMDQSRLAYLLQAIEGAYKAEEPNPSR